MDEEIKKHCLTLITHEFDTKADDDVISRAETLGDREVDTRSYRRVIDEATKQGEETTVAYERQDRKIKYPAIDIDGTERVGPISQFLEQAFEWEHISYIFYPILLGQREGLGRVDEPRHRRRPELRRVSPRRDGSRPRRRHPGL